MAKFQQAKLMPGRGGSQSRDLLAPDMTPTGCLDLGDEARRPPRPRTLVAVRPAQLETIARTRHGDIEQSALLRDLVLATAGLPGQLGGNPKAVAAMRLGKPAFDQGRHEDGVELEALGLVDRHHLDGGLDLLGLGDLLVGLRDEDELQVGHERS